MSHDPSEMLFPLESMLKTVVLFVEMLYISEKNSCINLKNKSFISIINVTVDQFNAYSV